MERNVIISEQLYFGGKKRTYYILLLEKNSNGCFKAVRFTSRGFYDGIHYDREERYSEVDIKKHLDDVIPIGICDKVNHHLEIIRDIACGDYRTAVEVCLQKNRKKLVARYNRNRSILERMENTSRERKALEVENHIIQLALNKIVE